MFGKSVPFKKIAENAAMVAVMVPAVAVAVPVAFVIGMQNQDPTNVVVTVVPPVGM